MSLSLLNMPLNSNVLRKHVLAMAWSGNSVHIGCAFSMIELFAVLYEEFVHFDILDPKNGDRDLVCLSKGHGVMAAYACLIELGVIDSSAISEYFSDGSLLKGLADCHVPGIEVTGGSLGHGITVATGLALAIQKKQQERKVFCLVGDGEMNEGSVWESLLFAAHWKLNNFILIVDENGFQAMGKTSDVLDCGSLRAKLTAFNFESWECDGHSRRDISHALSLALSSTDERPKAIIAHTVKGKGVSFMEANNEWHYARLDKDSYTAALSELNN